MVLGISPVDPLSGEDKYYIFAKGSYKVGRKGCDIIITKDKGVSRIHAEILVDAIASADTLQTTSSSLSCKVRIRDCSKYGTFINRNLGGAIEKVHESPNKEASLTDGNLISFGTGNATYKFSVVPFVFWVYSLKPNRRKHPLQDKLSSIGARIINNFSQECTHVLVDELAPVREDLLDAIVAKKTLILNSWVESVAEENICTEIPSCSSHTPTLTVDGVSVKLADPSTREGCLEGYTFVLDSINNYKFKNQLLPLLELSGAKVLSVESFSSRSQVAHSEANNNVIFVIPEGSATKSGCLDKLNSVSKAKETDLICAVLAGKLEQSILIFPCVVVSSSCSTDETIVEDSEAEVETATSAHGETIVASSVEVLEAVNKVDNSSVEILEPANKVEEPDDHVAIIDVDSFRPCSGGAVKRERVAECETENLDIIYSQYLVVRDVGQSIVTGTANNGVPNFKRFRKRGTKSGNSFDTLIPFSQYPYKESDYGNEEVAESVKEEKRRKQMEAIAEDLFNNEKARKRGVAGSLHGLLTKG